MGFKLKLKLRDVYGNKQQTKYIVIVGNAARRMERESGIDREDGKEEWYYRAKRMYSAMQYSGLATH